MIIKSIVEFGSSARSDNDRFSDKDYFIYVDEWDDRNQIIELATKQFDFLSNSKCDYIIHDTKSFEFMLDRGSLFLWHLKLEAKPIYGILEFNEMIKHLKEFDRYNQKFNNYLSVFQDLKEARKLLPQTSNFDYSILFTVVRNLSILCCYKLGKPKFGRVSAFEEVYTHFPNIALNLKEYKILMNYKLEYERGFKLVLTEERKIELWLPKIELFSKQIKNILKIE